MLEFIVATKPFVRTCNNPCVSYKYFKVNIPLLFGKHLKHFSVILGDILVDF